MMAVLRLLFLPELGRSLRELGGSAGRVRALCAVAFSPGAAAGGRRWGRLFERGRRARSAVGLGLMGAGAGFCGFGVAGLVSGEASAQSEVPALDFSELDDPFGRTSYTTEQILRFLESYRPGGPGEAPAALAQMLYVFNGGILVLAGFLLVYHTVAGTVATAREGRWGFGGWEVVRLVIAVALMVPLPPGGMNGGQHIVLGLAQLGGDFANTIWQPFADDMLGESQTAVPMPKDDLWRAAMARALVAETCRAVANAEVGNVPIGAPVMRREEGFILRERESEEGSIVYGYNARRVPNMCGAIRFVDVDDDQLSVGIGDVEPGEGEAGRLLAGNAHYRAFAGAPKDTGTSVLDELAAIADELQGTLRGRLVAEDAGEGAEGRGEYPELPDLDAKLEPVGTRYLAALRVGLEESARVETEDRRARLEGVERDVEWLAAASFINTIAYRTGSFHAVSYGVPEVVPPNYAALAEKDESAGAAVGLLVQELDRGRRFRPSHLRMGEQGLAGSLSGLGSSTEGLGGVLFGMFDLESVFVTTDDLGRTVNPIGQLASFGSSLIAAALHTYTGLIAATVAIHAKSAGVSAIPVLGKLWLGEVAQEVTAGARAVWDVGGGLVNMVLGILLIAGVMLAFVLPLIPFVRFLFGILTWLMTVVEAFLSITVFAAAHVTRGEGNQLTTSVTRSGWLFLPGLVLRPALMLFGFVLGYWVFVAGMTILNGVFVPYLKDADELSGIGLEGFIPMIVVYVFICYALINMSFKLIDILPTVAIEWIGGQGSGGAGGADSTMGGITSGVGRLAGLRFGR